MSYNNEILSSEAFHQLFDEMLESVGVVPLASASFEPPKPKVLASVSTRAPVKRLVSSKPRGKTSTKPSQPKPKPTYPPSEPIIKMSNIPQSLVKPLAKLESLPPLFSDPFLITHSRPASSKHNISILPKRSKPAIKVSDRKAKPFPIEVIPFKPKSSPCPRKISQFVVKAHPKPTSDAVFPIQSAANLKTPCNLPCHLLSKVDLPVITPVLPKINIISTHSVLPPQKETANLKVTPVCNINQKSELKITPVCKIKPNPKHEIKNNSSPNDLIDKLFSCEPSLPKNPVYQASPEVIPKPRGQRKWKNGKNKGYRSKRYCITLPGGERIRIPYQEAIELGLVAQTKKV